MERVQTQFLICRTGGCSFGSVGLIFVHGARFWDVGPALAPYWAMLSHFCGFCWPLLGKSWDHIGLVLGHFGLCWDILGHVGTILGSSWAILGSFRICVGLCFGLGHVSVVDFSSMQGVCKKNKNTRKKNTICIPQWISTTKCYDLGPGK